MTGEAHDGQVVVAALIERGGRLLISQRRPEAGHGGRWEFPAGNGKRASRTTKRYTGNCARNSGSTS